MLIPRDIESEFECPRRGSSLVETRRKNDTTCHLRLIRFSYGLHIDKEDAMLSVVTQADTTCIDHCHE